jgi:predicted nucleic acid-binding protein
VHEFIAVVTHPKFTPSTPLHNALDTIEAWSSSSVLRFIGEGPSYFELLTSLAKARKVRGAKIHDARIAAICLYHGVKKLWTADRDFSSFPKLKCENPLI